MAQARWPSFIFPKGLLSIELWALEMLFGKKLSWPNKFDKHYV